MFSGWTWIGTGLFLIRMAVAGTIWLTLGGLLLVAIREPARRTRVCGMILLGSLLIPVLALSVPGNLWGPQGVVSVDRPEIVEREAAAGSTSSYGPQSHFETPTPGPRPVPPIQLNSFGQSTRIEDSTEERSWLGAPPAEVAPRANRVARTTRYGVTSFSSAEEVFSWWKIGVASYFLGAGILTLWYATGLVGLGRIVRGARLPASSLAKLWQDVRGADLGSTPLKLSTALRQPIACWWGRSTVLLPAGWSDVTCEQVESALAHEAEHVRRGDFWSWQGANLARIVFWFHPLAWWLRRELRIGQDFLADAAAVRFRQSTADYAEFLTSSARLGLAHTSLVGLGLLGRRSELYRRVAMLLQRERPLEMRTPRWWSAALLSGGILTLGAVMTMRVIADPAPRSVSLRSSQVFETPKEESSWEAIRELVKENRINNERTGQPVKITLNAEQTKVIDKKLDEAFNENMVPKLMELAKAKSVRELDDILSRHGQSLRQMRNSWGDQQLAMSEVDNEVRAASNPTSTSGSSPSPDLAPRLGEAGTHPGALPSPSSLTPSTPAASQSSRPARGDEGGLAPLPHNDAAIIRKLVMQNGVVEPEAGVIISIDSLSEPGGVFWRPDGSRVDPSEGAFARDGFAPSATPPGMMGGSGGYASAGPAMMSPSGAGPGFPAESRQRTVFVRVHRPLPAGLHMSVDGQAVSRSSASLPDVKARQIAQTAFWPDEQMEGSIGVRFASKTVVRELAGLKREGEKIMSQDGKVEVRLGPWRQGVDLQTEIPIDGLPKNDKSCVIVPEAIDVDGAAHPGRIEFHRASGGDGDPFGGDVMGMNAPGMEGGMSGEGKGVWLLVFPHLPVDQIAKVRLTWHPYAWVIVRNVSLEPDHKTTPTAELFIDPT